MAVENLTQNGLTYALIGSIFRVYSWTIVAVILYILFRIFYIYNKNLNLTYLLLIAIPLFLSTAVLYSLELNIIQPILILEILIFLGGLLMLIPILLIYFYLYKGGGF